MKSLSILVQEAMLSHSKRKGCEWSENAFDAIIASSEFQAVKIEPAKSKAMNAIVDLVQVLVENDIDISIIGTPQFIDLALKVETYERCVERAPV